MACFPQTGANRMLVFVFTFLTTPHLQRSTNAKLQWNKKCNSLALTILLSSMVQLHGDGRVASEIHGGGLYWNAAHLATGRRRKQRTRSGEELRGGGAVNSHCVPFGAKMLPKRFPLGPSPVLIVRAFLLAKTFSIQTLRSATPRTVGVLPRRAPPPCSPVPNGIKPWLKVLTH